jgi:exopolysaccharide biosynthesis protein
MRRPSRRRSRCSCCLLTIPITIAVALGIVFLLTGSTRATRDRDVKVVRIPAGERIELRPVLAQGKMHSGETFLQMIARLSPYAAINGTLYDERMRPLGDILIDGKLVNRGHYRHAVAVRNDGHIVFVERRGRRFRWSGYRMAVASGPRLVHGGKISLDPVADGFSRKSLTIRAWRTGIGTTKSEDLLLVVVERNITLAQLAKIMHDLGASEAMNLDGGGACGLYHNGRLLAIPSLPMTNIIAVYKR